MSLNRTVYVGPYLVVTDKNKDLPGMFEAIFKNEDQFSSYRIESVEGNARTDGQIIVLPNRKGQGGAYIKEYSTETSMPTNNLDHADWLALINHFTKFGIKYRREYGIVNFWR